MRSGPHRELGLDADVLLLGLRDVLCRDAVDAQRLERRLDVGRGVVVVRLPELEVARRERLVIEQVLVAVERALCQIHAVLRLPIGGDRVLMSGLRT